MIKLNKQFDALEAVQEKIQTKIEELEEKQTAIEDNAADHDRDLTAAEQRKWDKLQTQIEELEAESDDIGNAVDYLRDYI